MHDAIQFVIYPSLILFTLNWKVDLCVTTPLAIAAIYWNLQMAFSKEDANMACYEQSDQVAQTQFTRTLIYFIVFMGVIHDNRKIQITRFIAQERAKKQQECLQNIFDKQPDGVIILSKPLESAKPGKQSTEIKEAHAATQDPNGQRGNASSDSCSCDDESMSNSSESYTGMNDPQFSSFVNSTQNADYDTEFEVVFHNGAITDILNKLDLQGLNNLLDKPVFVNTQLKQPISLLGVAQNRYSDDILCQVHRMNL